MALLVKKLARVKQIMPDNHLRAFQSFPANGVAYSSCRGRELAQGAFRSLRLPLHAWAATGLPLRRCPTA